MWEAREVLSPMTGLQGEHVERLEHRIKEFRAEANYWRDEVLELVDEDKRGTDDHKESLQNFWRARRELNQARRKLERHAE